MSKKIAIIDLGSNSVRMNLYSINEKGGYCVFEQAKEMVRLSEGLEIDGLLKPEPINRTLEALKYFKQLIHANDVETVYALSTAAVRMAKNQQEFLDRIKEVLNLEFVVLSGLEEAYYDFLGVVNTLHFKDAIIIDIGGASTEIILVKNRKMEKAISMPFGSVTLTEKFNGKKKQAQAYVEEQISQLDWIGSAKGLPIIGLGGMMRSLGKIHQSITQSSLINLHNYHITPQSALELIEMLQTKPLDSILKLNGVNKKRADLMPLGIIPIKELLKRLDSPVVRISAYGLRDGYFFEKALNRESIVNDVLNESIKNIKRRFLVNEEHANNVRIYAETLFDDLNMLHDFSDEDRRCLSVAAELHDIGMHIEYYDHHLHGMYLIINSKIDGLTHEEHLKVAFLVGNHREGSIKDRYKQYDPNLSKNNLMKLQKLSLLLQISEQIDRSETGNVSSISAMISGDNATIALKTNFPSELDIASAMRYSERFKKYYGKNLNIIHTPADVL